MGGPPLEPHGLCASAGSAMCERLGGSRPPESHGLRASADSGASQEEEEPAPVVAWAGRGEC